MTKHLPPQTEMLKAFYSSNSAYDGVFYTAVRTTGIFCRPSCRVRKPLERNITFYGTINEALYAGYRPCKKCHPLQVGDNLPPWAVQLLDIVEREPNRRLNDQFLREQKLAPETVRRFWQRRFGLSFHAYVRGMRLSYAYRQIQKGTNMDHTAIDLGYESLSGFRDAFAKQFGTAPGSIRNNDAGAGIITLSWLETPLGPMVAGATEKGICLLEFTDRRMMETQLKVLQKRFGQQLVPGNSPRIEQLRTELVEYFAGKRTQFSLPLDYPGTPFEQRVWGGLLGIPYGTTTTYEALAHQLGNRLAQRAVGRANGCNRISIVIPCHRVVNKGGALGGYGGKLWRKQLLLQLEHTRRPLTPEEIRAAYDRFSAA
jgi:AraC family transcriptional regulator of adaptative response/methylated-DNA-[protein]-cysteine methyltransferase